jgi:hypothetical protein
MTKQKPAQPNLPGALIGRHGGRTIRRHRPGRGLRFTTPGAGRLMGVNPRRLPGRRGGMRSITPRKRRR